MAARLFEAGCIIELLGGRLSPRVFFKELLSDTFIGKESFPRYLRRGSLHDIRQQGLPSETILHII